MSWPLGKNIDKWIIALLKGLAAVKKFSILIEVSLAKIEKVGGPCPSLGMWPFTLLSSGSSQVWDARYWGPSKAHCVTGLIHCPSLGLGFQLHPSDHSFHCVSAHHRSPNSGCPSHLCCSI